MKKKYEEREGEGREIDGKDESEGKKEEEGSVWRGIGETQRKEE